MPNYYKTPAIFQACHYHAEKGLKKEPNDTGGPDLNTKILELQVAIRNSEREKVSKWCVTQCPKQCNIVLLAAPTSKGNFLLILKSPQIQRLIFLFLCQVKAEARLNKLREGGVNVDEYIDAFVYAAAAAQQQQQQHRPVSQHEQQAAGATEWPESETASQAQDQVSQGGNNLFPLPS